MVGVNMFGECINDRIKLLMSTNYYKLRKAVQSGALAAIDLVIIGFCDVIKLFIKGEPHPRLKALQQRWRLICAVSINDQAVEREIYHRQFEAEIAVWFDCNSAIGLGVDRQKLSLLWDRLATMRRKVSTDQSGFDWSCYFEETERATVDLLRDAGITSDHPSEIVRRLWHAAMTHCLCMAFSVLMDSDGVLWAQTFLGIQKSGRFLTGELNGRMRVNAAKWVGSSDAFVMGDDCVEDSQLSESELVAAYARIGKRATDYYAGTSDYAFDFCSLRFWKTDRVHAVPTSWPRILFKLLSKQRFDFDELLQFLLNIEEIEWHDAALYKRICTAVARHPSASQHSAYVIDMVHELQRRSEMAGW